MVETKGRNNLVLWELELCSPLPFQTKQDHSNRIAVSTRPLTRSQRAQESCHGLFLMLFPSKLAFQDSHCKSWVVASLTTRSSTVSHDQICNMQSHPLQVSVSLTLFQVMQVSQVPLASQEHLEVRGQTISALILRSNADILVEALKELL